MKAAPLGELADAGTEGDQLGSADVGGSLDQRLADIVYSILLKTKAVSARVRIRAFVRWVFDDVLEIVAGELEELLEHCRSLLLIQWPHPASK